METLSSIKKWVNDLSDERADFRTKHWLFCNDPWTQVYIGIAYLLVIFSLGRYMKNRKPYDVQKLIQIYNVFQVIGCFYLVFRGFQLGYNPFDWKCKTLGDSVAYEVIEFAALTWYYHILKITDLLDTVFFMLRKNFHLVTVLHVEHHLVTLWISWGVVTFAPGGSFWIIGILNSFVHVFMYGYYFLSLCDSYKTLASKWKASITQLQVVQLVIVCCWCVTMLCQSCVFPRWLMIIMVIQGLFLITLFLNFYIKTYLKKTNKKKIR